MKRKFFIYILCLTLLVIGGACESWLDVKPKQQIEADVLYQRESGFKDVLTGAYISMTTPAMYGRELTFGLVDVIGSVYPEVGNGIYYRAKNFEYDWPQVETMINNIWQSSYNIIANLNYLIEQLKKADPNMFSEDNYNVIYGEALGLRAMLHFDLLRLFAPSYLAGKDALAIPYVTRYTFATTPEYTVSTVLDSILTDLKFASLRLHQSDPIVTGRNITASVDDGYLLNRSFRMNYFAVQALLARVYLYKSDMANAVLCAQEVIDSEKFRWLTLDEISALNAVDRDRTFSPEQVFVLEAIKMEDNLKSYLQASGISTTNLLSFTTTYIDNLYPVSSDWRKLYLWTEPEVGKVARYSTKFWQIEGMERMYQYRLPLIRLPELYLIVAEALIESNFDKAIDVLNEVRLHRGHSVTIPLDVSREFLYDEILQEYRREFISEGVLFYQYKRLDAASIIGAPATFDKTKYVLPMPSEEIEFGQRN